MVKITRIDETGFPYHTSFLNLSWIFSVESTGKYLLKILSKLGVDAVVDHWVDQGGGHGHPVDSKVHILNPGMVGNT